MTERGSFVIRIHPMLETISKRKLGLCLGDFIIITLLQIPAFLIVVERRYFLDFSQKYFWVFLFISFVWILVLFISRAYEVIEGAQDTISDTNIFVKATIISVITLGFIFYLFAPFIDFPQRVLLVHGFLVIAVLYLWRVIFTKLIHRAGAIKKILILGTDWPAQEVAKEIANRPNHGYALIGFIGKHTNEFANVCESKYEYKSPSNNPLNPPLLRGNLKREYEVDEKFILGTEEETLEVVNKYQIDLVISALPGEKSQKMVQNILEIQQRGVPVVEMPDFYEELTGKIPIQHLAPSWIILGQFKKITKTKETVEYIFNALLALLLLIVTLPITITIALIIKSEDKGPIFYQQKRVGKNGKIFTLIKFRNMKPNAEQETGAIWVKKDDERITKTGKFLRKWRLDEIPQLINILFGQMVFIGPRPERPEFVEKLEKEIPFYRMRHLVKPGLTGWAQVRFRYAASTEDALQKLQYELYYIKHRSFLFDLIIILKTIEVVITGRGAR